MEEKCPLCASPIEKYTEKKCLESAKEMSKDGSHFHYGIPYYRYSICPQHHLYKQGLVKTVWNPCLRCKFTDIVKKGEIAVSEPMSARDSAVDSELKKLRRELEFLKRLLLKKR